MVTIAVPTDHTAIAHVSELRLTIAGASHSGEVECLCRCPVMSNPDVRSRVVLTSLHFPGHRMGMGNLLTESVSYELEPQASPFHVPPSKIQQPWE